MQSNYQKAWLAGIALAASALPLNCIAADHKPTRVENPLSVMEYALNVAAKQICSDHFISGFPVDDIVERSVLKGEWTEQFVPISFEHLPYTKERYKAALRDVHIDKRKKIVSVASGPYVGKARYYGDQGCTMLNPFESKAYFEPQDVPRISLQDDIFPASGDLLSSPSTLPAIYDAEELQRAVDIALAPKDSGAALIVMHKGKLVIERYAEGITDKTPLLNWSMGKSILGTLIGRLEQKGMVSLDAPAPVDIWHVFKDDPRRHIKTIDLLRMSSGLSCSRRDPLWARRGIAPDHDIIYLAPVDVIQNAIYSPYKTEPNKVWKYSNCDMQALGYILKRALKATDANYLSWPYEELYNKIGMSGMVSEVDAYGNFHLTGYDYGTARDWARYGLLYLNDGVWNGERLLSEAFVNAAQTPGPAWFEREKKMDEYPQSYGATHWLNTGGRFALPTDTFFAAGYSDNYAFITPSEDLVVVILRYTGADAANAEPNDFLTPLVKGLGISTQ